MEIPILRYLDIVIGLAVIVLLVSTIVASATQLLLSSTYGRSRNLRDGIEDLVAQVEPKLLKGHARYIAERLLRHPLVARDNTLPGEVAWWIRCYFRSKWKPQLPLPNLNPPDTIQREEIILLLLEWAAEDGALYQQDVELAARWPASANWLSSIRAELRAALQNRGIADPAGTAQGVRLQIMQNEAANPGQPSQLWRMQAVVASAPSDFVARVHSWYDNGIARIKQAYALQAKVVASIVAAIFICAVQVDALNLLRQLSSDDKLRASLVSEAQIQTKRIEDAQAAQKAAPATPAAGQATQPAASPSPAADQAKQIEDDATLQREKIAENLAALRDPSRNIVPSYFLWQAVAQARICRNQIPQSPAVVQGTIVAGPTSHSFKTNIPSGLEIDEIGTAIRDSGAPISVFNEDASCLRLIALTPAYPNVGVLGQGLSSTDLGKRIDTFGFFARLPGMLLMWVLVSLGSPFWYDLLKKLLGFRSILSSKDDDERQFREDEQVPLQPAPSPSAATALPQQPPQNTPASDVKPALVLTTASANIRIGSPSRSAPIARTVPADTLVHVLRSVVGEAVSGPDNQPIDLWYQTVDGEYLWSGVTGHLDSDDSGRLESV